MTALLLVLGLSLQLASGGAALESDLEGVVMDGGGRPVAAAEIALHAGEEVLRTTTTGPDGRFRFTAPLRERARFLSVHRLGFLPQRIPLEPDSAWIEVVLEADPLQLQGLTVQAERDLCEQEEDEDARRMWEAAAERHRLVPDTVGMATYLLAATGVVSEDDVGSADPGELERGQRGSAPLLRFGWLRRIQREGYAFPVRRTGPEGSYDSWSYAPLEAELAFHFVSPSFGRLHRFHFASDEPGRIIVFCPRDRERPGIEGQLHFSVDSTLVHAEWLFRTPEPSERSGGRVYFPDGSSLGESEPFLVPSEGLFWRRRPDGRFLQKYQRYQDWIFAPGDSVPFLPRRTP